LTSGRAGRKIQKRGDDDFFTKEEGEGNWGGAGVGMAGGAVEHTVEWLLVITTVSVWSGSRGTGRK
jgi:hypothetical protein